jgi:hypothetical protein
VAYQPRLIIQAPGGGALERQLSERPPQGVLSGDVVIEIGRTDAQGNLEPPGAGQVVMSLPSPEGLERDAGDVRRVIGQAGTGVEPLVVVVEVAEELRDEELDAILDAASHSSRAVIVRIIRDA